MSEQQALYGDSEAELKILSMGWGVQTWTLAAMMALDEMERADYLVFADTLHERQDTYNFIRRWEPWLGEHGLTLITVQGKRTDVIRGEHGSVLIPAYSYNGKNGQMRRQCTHDWKIAPIRKFTRLELQRRGKALTAGAVHMLMGISTNEWWRARDSDVRYITNCYPLLDLRMSRMDCVLWLEHHNLPQPPKSACTFCPFRNDWVELKQHPDDWAEAVRVDEAIRERRRHLGYTLYVHSARMPLAEAVHIPEDIGAHQYDLFGCDGGFCGV